MSVTPEEVTATDGGLTTAPAVRPVPMGIVRVNLVPAELAEARMVRNTAAVAAGAAVLVAVGVGILYHQQGAKQDDAKRQLAAAQTENTRLQGEESRLGSVDGLYAKVDAATSMYQAAAGPQVLWSRYLEDLRLQLPDHVYLTSLTATETGGAAAAPTAAGSATAGASGRTAAGGSGAGASAAAAPAPVSSVGSLTFAGAAYTHNDVADLLDKLASLRGVSSPYLSSSTQSLIGTGSTALSTVNFNTTASLTSDALKSSYDGTPTP